jgi:hypothetical protein
MPQEDILELVHAGVGKQQRGIVGQHQRRAAHHAMAVGSEIVEEFLADLGARHVSFIVACESVYLGAADYLKPGIAKVAIERERLADPLPAHDGEGNAIGKADLLIGVLSHPAERFDLILPRGLQYVDAFGRVQVLDPICGESVPGDPAKQRRNFIHHVVASRKRPYERRKHLDGLAVVLVLFQVKRQKRARVDEDQCSSP